MIIAKTTQDFISHFSEKKMGYTDYALYEQLCIKEGKKVDVVCDHTLSSKIDAI